MVTSGMLAAVDARERPMGTCHGRSASDGYHLSHAGEGAMTSSHVRALTGRAGALLGAIAVLITGCTAAGGGSGPRADRADAAHDAVATRPPGHIVAHRAARTTGPGGFRHGGGARIAWATPLSQCAHPVGHQMVYPAGASRSPVAVPMCLCCRWRGCAWACCGCGPSCRPPRWWSRPHLAWLRCSRWRWPPGCGSSRLPPGCGPGCRARTCLTWRQPPVPGPASAAAGSSRDRSSGVTAGAS